jgi:hypothetical protein
VKNYTAATALPSVKAAGDPVIPRLNPTTLTVDQLVLVRTAVASLFTVDGIFISARGLCKTTASLLSAFSFKRSRKALSS